MQRGRRRRGTIGRTVPKPGRLCWHFRPGLNLCHFLQIDGFTALNPDHQIAKLSGITQEGTGMHQYLLVMLGHALRAACLINALQPLRHLGEGQPMCAQRGRIQGHHHRLIMATISMDIAGAGQTLELGFQLVGNPCQRGCVLLFAPQGQRHDRHIINATRLDHRLADTQPGRQPVLVGIELVIEIHNRLLAFDTNLEHRHDQRAIWPREGVQGIDTGQLRDHLLGGRGDQVLYLARCGTRVRNIDIGEGDIDLRLLFARCDQHGKQTE